MTEKEFKDLLNSEQEKALEFEDHLTVTANAGSGKTYLLVYKYLYLLLFYPDKFNIDNITAVTFTKKAASEIKLSLSERINELKSNNRLNEQQIEIADDILKNLTKLKISTIHSFCNEILNRFPVRAGLEPDFEIIPSPKKIEITDKIIYETISDLYSSEFINKIDECVSNLGSKEFIQHLKTLEYNSRKLDKVKEFYNNGPEIITEYFAEVIIDNRLPEIMDAIYHLLDKDLTDEKFSNGKNILNDLKEKIESGSNKSEIVGLISKLTSEKISGRFFIVKVLGNTNKRNDYEDSIVELFQDLSYKISGYSLEDADILKKQLRIGNYLIEIAEKVIENIKSFKAKFNYLEHDDILNLTNELLSKDNIRSTIQSELSYIMIDEFQDTDHVQMDIINKLIGDSEIKFFVVGDDKQSIYRFRGADVRVFKNLRESLDNKYNLELKNSFRSDIEINDFVNKVFSDLMDAERSEYDSGYQEFVSIKKDNEPEKEKVKFVIYNKKDNNDDDEIEINENNTAASEILNILEKYEYEPGDIAVLSASSKNLINLSTELRKRNVPYEMITGSGFYSRNEIKDIINYLNFINDVYDDISCAATLKSAFFNYTDTDLLNISACEGDYFWEKFNNYAEYDGQSQEVIKKINNIISVAPRIPLSNLIVKMIDDSNWNQYYSQRDEKSTVFNNFYKFLRICRDYEKRSYTSIVDFLKELKIMTSYDSDAEEANTDSNTVKLSTIHKAKGLQFKCVIILGFGSGGGRNTTDFDEKYGLNFKVPANTKFYHTYGKTDSILNRLIYLHNKTAEDAEELRKYYVAMTRAMEKLILVMPSSGIKGEFRNSFENIICEEIKNLDSRKVFLSENKIKYYDEEKKQIFEKSIDYNIAVNYNELNDLKYKPKKADDKAIEQMNNIDAIPSSEKDITFSPSKLKILVDEADKDKFKRKYIYGLPEVEIPLLSYEDEEIQIEKEFDGSEFGLIFHGIMENIDRILIDNKIDDSQFKTEIEKQSKYTGIEVSDDTQVKIYKYLNDTLDSSFFSEKSDKLLKSTKEYSLRMAFGDHFLTGIFDAFLIDNNTAEIWDWKTNKFSKDETIDSKSESYSFQMKLYALLALKLDENIKTVYSRLFYVRKAGNAANENDWIKTYEFHRDDIESIELELIQRIGGIKERYKYLYPVTPVGG